MNLTKTAQKYIDSRPSIRDCLKKQLLNYSELSRQIIIDSGLKNSDFDAVVVAVRRYFLKLSKSPAAQHKITGLLSDSRIDIKNKIMAVVIDKNIFTDDLLDLERKIKKSRNAFYAIEGTDAITIITASVFLKEIQKTFRSSIVRIWQDLAIVVIGSSEEIEEIPGVLSYLASLLSDAGVNVLETMSCWSETLFVVSESDISRVLEALKF
jgi:hypothetical protein